jgi:hypothetical protein
MDIKPQPGFQYNFLKSSADITIGGGAAGCGKTHASLMKPLRHVLDVEGYDPVFFRRTYAQIRNTGGLWDASSKMYPYLGAKQTEGERWKFDNGNKISFSHLQHEKNKIDHQGAEYPLILFDELTHFSETQFFYLLSRNRSTCGVKPQTVATCNPDPDSFVARLVDWWIDQETGFPIKERAGVKRYFVKDEDVLIWGDSKAEVIGKAKYLFDNIDPKTHNDFVKSMTFIPGDIYQNQELLKVNPGYLANLMAQDEEMKARLLYGNWKIRADNTSLFDWQAINDIFSNYTDNEETRYITCDAARYGRDFCVIFVWKGWQIIHTSILKRSDVHDIVQEIEWCREKFTVQKSKTLVDADGVGADTVKKGRYLAFHGGAKAKNGESYDNLKTQCYYKLAEENVNIGNFSIQLSNGTCKIDGHFTTKIKVGAKLMDVRDLIIADFRAIKQEGDDIDGKKKINPKESQKNILDRSPDFSDSAMMKKAFDLMKTTSIPIMRK